MSKVIPIPFEGNTAGCDQFVNLELFALMILAASFRLFSILNLLYPIPSERLPLVSCDELCAFIHQHIRVVGLGEHASHRDILPVSVSNRLIVISDDSS